jgi:hypothetical protein
MKFRIREGVGMSPVAHISLHFLLEYQPASEARRAAAVWTNPVQK